MKKLKNKNIGAKVIVKEVLVEISAKVGWRRLKNVSGVIVKRGSHEQYYYSCTGAYTYIQKNIIYNDHLPNLAVKLDNGVIDIAGNNIIVVREEAIKFIDFLPASVKIISKKEYKKAQNLIEQYEFQQTLL